MNRRDFLKNAAVAGMAVQQANAPAAIQPRKPSKADGTWRGVNLGGWLALEKWITPVRLCRLQAEDEYTLCEALGKARAAARLKQHRETWITADDFRWLAAHGINAVRLPVGYGGRRGESAVPPRVRHGGLGLSHGRPARHRRPARPARRPRQPERLGPQRPPGQARLAYQQENIDHSLRILTDLAARCKGYDNLLGIELLNEPRWDVPIEILKTFYQDAYHRVREQIGKDRGAVVIHDAFRPLEWADFMREPEYVNVILDTHPYQCFNDEDRKRDLHGQVEFALLERKKLLDGMQAPAPLPGGRVVVCAAPGIARGPERLRARRRHAGVWRRPVDQFRRHPGWFFWTYKTEEGGAWSFRDCVQRGWLPERFAV